VPIEAKRFLPWPRVIDTHAMLWTYGMVGVMHRWECLGEDTLLGSEDTLVEERERHGIEHLIDGLREREGGYNDS